MFEFSSGGRRVSPDQFFKEFQERAVEQATQDLEERVHGTAASIIDPETGKHPTGEPSRHMTAT